MKKHIIRHSIKRQFAFTFIGVMSATIFLCWFINNTFLPRYYERNRINDLLDGYEIILKAAETDSFFSEEFKLELQQMSGRSNISSIVSINMGGSNISISCGDDTNMLLAKLNGNLYGEFTANKKIISITEDYFLQKVFDAASKSEYLEIYGVVGNVTGFLLRTPYENIEESVSIANRFLVYIGLAAIFLSSIVIWFIIKKITASIVQLTDISERMIHLDFEAKYSGKDDNEIALLGDNINKLSENLEKTISELKTANNELKKDVEKKNRIDEMRKEFLSNVSHELKTPIALIQGYAEGLAEGINEDAESRSFYCDVIMDEASKMNMMVKKLMTLNQLEFGNDIVSLERFDLADLICNYVQSAQILTKPNNIKVRMEHYTPIYVWADEFKTEEVFMNYFTNAVNHAAGEKIIEIKLEQKEQKVRISVFNTGDPIPQESLAQIWDKFYKVDKARTREYGGSGVGLSIVKAIMDSLNQKYGVNNCENGVEFWFELETVK